jgi:ABC-type transporter Mla subunit MlaD
MSERIVAVIFGDPLVKWFSLLILSLFVLGLFAHLNSRAARGRNFAHAMPATLISLGILGTFAGIFLGLIDFDVRKVDDSVPKLLEGMKFAFITSIIGLSSGISFRILTTIFPARSAAAKSGATADDIHAALIEVRDTAREAASSTREGLANLRSSIAGDSDGSLLTQIQRLRTDSSDQSKVLNEAVRSGFDKQQEEFRAFARTMSENNAKALVEALRELIRDFNQKIHEQFGDNFRHLHDAVSQLLEWQVQYRKQIEAMVSAFESARSGIEATKHSIGEIASRAEAIPATMGLLAQVLRGLQMQTDDLGRHLKAFEEIRVRATDALPHIERSLTGLTDGLRASIEQALQQSREFVAGQHQTLADLTRNTAHATQESIRAVNENLANQQRTISNAVSQLTASAEKSVAAHSEALRQHIRSFAQTEEGFTKLHEQARGAVDQFSKVMQEATKSLSERVSKVVEEQSKLMQAKLADSHRGFEQLLKQSGERLAKHFEEFDKQMQDEVGRVIQVMGNKLAGLSNKFVEDYSPLTEKLRQLVSMTPRV